MQSTSVPHCSSRGEKPKASFEASPILRGCFLTKTSLSTADRFPPNGRYNVRDQDESPRAWLIESPRFVESPKNLRGSSRFFVQTGASRSLAEQARPSVCGTDDDIDQEPGGDTDDVGFRQQESVNTESAELPEASVAVVKYSLEPQAHFRQSMMDMVGSRLARNLAVDWDYLEELVLCYLELNEKSCQEYIVNALFDVLEELFG